MPTGDTGLARKFKRRLRPAAALPKPEGMSAAHDHHGDHHGHEHGHGHGHHHGHHHGPPVGTRAYAWAVGLNLAFVAAEVTAGVLARSTALLADAGHNFSDALGLVLAGVAAWFATRPASAQRTFGYGKAPVIAALVNGLLLMFASGALALEAVKRIAAPEPTAGLWVMAVAGVGVLVNGGSALLFLRGRAHDVNARGAFLHLAADAAVSLAVILAGLAIWTTGWTWIDPAMALAVVAVIVASTWGLLREALDLAMDTAPAAVDVAAVRAFLVSQPGVAAVHDLHVWRHAAAATSLTAHVVAPDGVSADFLAGVSHRLRTEFGIAHATVQIETAAGTDCPTC